jgi:hypothetical protein
MWGREKFMPFFTKQNQNLLYPSLLFRPRNYISLDTETTKVVYFKVKKATPFLFATPEKETGNFNQFVKFRI